MNHNLFAPLRQENSHYIIWVFITNRVKVYFSLSISFNIKCLNCELMMAGSFQTCGEI